MAQDIDGTSGLTNGAYQKPTSVDNGTEFSAIVSDFMERMAVHTHSGANALPAVLPSSAKETTAKVPGDFSAVAGKGLYTTTITLSNIDARDKNLGWYYNLTPADDTPANWKQFYPEVSVDATGKILTLTVNRNDFAQIRVIG